MTIMKNAGQWAVEKQWSDRDLEEAKLSVFQSVDAPQAVSEEGMTRFLSGVSDEMLQERRERLLDVSKEQVREVAQKYVVDALEEGKGRMAFLGEKKPWVDGSWETMDMGPLVKEEEIVDEEDVKNAALGS
jgi:presequence protease